MEGSDEREDTHLLSAGESKFILEKEGIYLMLTNNYSDNKIWGDAIAGR
ncbi:MAG: hypothetical protein M1379_08630 [Firmicutes bacterium]|nr:hypothetical protein [Bacillota bacterium]